MKPFVGTPTDYSKPEHWLACPNNPNKPVDLLYLYPSSCENPIVFSYKYGPVSSLIVTV